MKKIQDNGNNSIHDLKTNDILNPQQNQTRCKICFEESKPLVTLCDCTGSIAYVHQDCILDWIALKMQKSQHIQIPKCEICKCTFSATMQIGCKKINNQLLLQKAKKSTPQQWIYGILYFIGFIVSFITLLVSVFNLLLGNSLIFQSIGMVIYSFIRTGFVDFVFPIVFFNMFVAYLKGKWKILDDCKVQIVEVTLLPKKILKA